MNLPESIALAYNDLAQGGSSDKVYHVAIGREGDTDGETFAVAIQYGRRGSALFYQTTGTRMHYEQAKKLFDKIVREKKAKGYREEGKAPAPQVAPSGAAVADIKPPELLEEVTNGAVDAFVRDPAYWMQDKSDGVSRGVVKQAGLIFGINKRGQTVPLPAELVAELEQIPLDAFQIDAELVGNKLICRDLLVANEDISRCPYYERFATLQGLLHPAICKGVLLSVVETWTSVEFKAAALKASKEARREGVVFKLTSAPYRAGRNGQHKKFKFIKTLSAIAGPPKQNGKESVELFLIPAKSVALNAPVRCGTVSLIGKPKVNEGDVVEVAYLYAMPSGLMVQARLLSVRADVDQSECTTAQLIYKLVEAE